MLLLGSNVSENKAASLALQSIYGVGKKSAVALCNLLGVNPQTKIDELNSVQLELLMKNCRRLISSNKRRDKVEAIKSLVKISCYRGTRHMNALPCRGQKTRTNASTSKKLLSKFRIQLKN